MKWRRQSLPGDIPTSCSGQTPRNRNQCLSETSTAETILNFLVALVASVSSRNTYEGLIVRTANAPASAPRLFPGLSTTCARLCQFQRSTIISTSSEEPPLNPAGGRGGHRGQQQEGLHHKRSEAKLWGAAAP